MDKKKIYLYLIIGFAVGCLVGGLSGAFIASSMLLKKQDKVEDVKGIVVAAPALAKEYTADEKAADGKYLNKAIEVTGTIGEVEKNQDGGVMAILQTEDPTTGIQCAMREKNSTVAKGQSVTIKGFCSGNGITGVSLTDCVIK